jgi:hypothetical protein
MTRRSAVLALLLVGCTMPRAVAPPQQPLGARKLVGALQRSLQQQSLPDLVELFTPDCRAGCRGFVPHPIGTDGRRVRARWTPRLEDGDLLEDLARGLLSYSKLEVARLEPREWRSWDGVTLLRAELTLAGRDRDQRRLEDRGVVDLALQRRGGGWRIARLSLTRVDRTVELHPAEAEALMGGGPRPPLDPTSRPATMPEQDRAEKPETDEPPAGDEPAAGDGLLPDDLLALAGRSAAGELPLRRLAGKSATLLLLSEGRCPSCASLCEKLAALVARRSGCAALHLRLGPAQRNSCGLSELRASTKTTAALDRVRGLLPLLVLVDDKGRAVRMASGGVAGTEIEMEVERRCSARTSTSE